MTFVSFLFAIFLVNLSGSYLKTGLEQLAQLILSVIHFSLMLYTNV